MKKLILLFAVILFSSNSVSADISIDSPVAVDTTGTTCSNFAHRVARTAQEDLGTDYWPVYFAAYGHCLEQLGII